MERNYAYECGSFMALSRLLRDDVRELLAAKDDWEREFMLRRLAGMADQVDETLEELGYTKEGTPAAISS
jgi:hypothetical protein